MLLLCGVVFAVLEVKPDPKGVPESRKADILITANGQTIKLSTDESPDQVTLVGRPGYRRRYTRGDGDVDLNEQNGLNEDNQGNGQEEGGDVQDLNELVQDLTVAGKNAGSDKIVGVTSKQISDAIEHLLNIGNNDDLVKKLDNIVQPVADNPDAIIKLARGDFDNLLKALSQGNQTENEGNNSENLEGGDDLRRTRNMARTSWATEHRLVLRYRKVVAVAHHIRQMILNLRNNRRRQRKQQLYTNVHNGGAFWDSRRLATRPRPGMITP